MNENKLNVKIKKEFHGFNLIADWATKAKVTCLFGYTGSGKTLTFRIIAGLVKPDSGYIRFNDVVFFNSARKINISPQKRNIGFVFQNNMLFPHMTVYQNILYGLSDEKNKKKEIGDIIKIFRLETLENKYPHEISGGQQKRTAIARAVIRNPKLLLFDEPFNSLDHAVKKKMFKDILTYQIYLDVPIILITHDIDELHNLAEWVILYNEGKIEQCGEPKDVFFKPQNRVSARLVATKNILDGRVVSIGNGMIEVLTEKKIRLFACRSNHGPQVNVDDKVIYCIRPECFSLLENGSMTGNQNGISKSNIKKDNVKKMNIIRGTVVDFTRNTVSYDIFFRIEDSNYDFEMKVSIDDFQKFSLARYKTVSIGINENMIHLIRNE